LGRLFDHLVGGVSADMVATLEDVTRDLHALDRAPVRSHSEGREGPGGGDETGWHLVVPLLGVVGGFDGEAAGGHFVFWLYIWLRFFSGAAFPRFGKKKLTWIYW
jgi:hypothetical protein